MAAECQIVGIALIARTDMQGKIAFAEHMYIDANDVIAAAVKRPPATTGT